MLKNLIIALRPKQWIKNCFVFAALIFSKNLLNSNDFILTSLSFILFSLLASSIYLINDIKDKEEDKNHPVKCTRPIASGKLKTSYALAVSILLAIISIPVGFYINYKVGIVLSFYFFMNLAYSLKLKHIVILDVLIISTGFVLRAIVGAVAINVEISSWLIICTISISLFLALSKRRHELVLLNNNAIQHRKILSEYSPYFLDQMIAVVTASSVISYALYTTSKEVIHKLGTENLIYTIPFVLYGIFRYLYLIHQKEKGGDPTKIMLTDKPLIICVLLWGIMVVGLLYLPAFT